MNYAKRWQKKLRKYSQRHKSAAMITASSFLAFVALLVALGPVSWLIAGDTVRRLPDKDKAEAVNVVRQTLLTGIGGAAVLGGLAYTARSYNLSKRGQVTDRFSGAVSLLASEKTEERLGAVYSLEHVLTESPQDHLTIVNLLANFVRNRTRLPRTPSDRPLPRSTGQSMPEFGIEPDPDIAAALRVLAARPKRSEPYRIDLRHATLTGLYVRDFEFSSQPSFKSALFTWVDLRAGNLRGVDLTNAIFTNADLRKCDFSEAKLERAILARADLQGARLGEAMLDGARLEGADLRDCTTLAARQLSGAFIDENTHLPDHLQADEWVLARLAVCNAHDDHRTVPPATEKPH